MCVCVCVCACVCVHLFVILFVCVCVCLADQTRCNAWVLDGDLYHKGLQGVAVPVGAVGSSVLVVTVDMSRPWHALDSLQKWAAVAREHIDKLRVPPETLRDLEHRRESGADRVGRSVGTFPAGRLAQEVERVDW